MRVLSLWIVVYLFQRRIEEEIWLVIFWTFLLKRRIIGGNSLIRTRKNEFVLSFQYVLVVVDVALYSLYSWMVVYNTESACVFRDFLITFFLLRASSLYFRKWHSSRSAHRNWRRDIYFGVAQTTRAFPLKGTTFSYVHVRPFTAASLASLVFAPPK